MKHAHGLALGLLLLASGSGLAAGTCHVWQESPSPAAPYDTWATAAHDIQTAISYASTNLTSYDNVLVTNGTYALSSGLSITKAVTVASVNGPEKTAITRSGAGITLLTFTTGASGAVVDGFSFTNNPATSVLMNRGILRNCVIANHGSTSGTITGVDLIGGLVENCVITNWSSRFGAGVKIGTSPSGVPTVRNCRIERIRLSNADTGGAGITMTQNGLVDRCLIRNCSSSLGSGKSSQGGGVRMTSGTLRNCLVTGNWIASATARGGGVGVAGGTVENCTITGNSAEDNGGGVFQTAGTVRNTIVYGNSSVDDDDLAKTGGTFTYSCTSVLPGGANDINNTPLAPLFTDASGADYRLDIGSPAIDSGMTITAVTNDLDGVARPIDGDSTAGALHDMGAYEAPALADREGLSCTFTAFPLRGWGPLDVAFTANVSVAAEDLPDVTYDWQVSANGAVVHTSTAEAFTQQLRPGLYSVQLVVTFDGRSATNARSSLIEVGASTNYVAASGSNTHPYDSWETAAHSINDAVATAFADGEAGAVVRVAAGEYALTNDVAILKPITVQSVAGRAATGITRASGSFFTLSMAGAVLDGFALTNGAATIVTIHAGTVRNCRIADNDATFEVVDMTGGTLEDCLVENNACRFIGGVSVSGAGSLVNRCVITGNSAWNAGGDTAVAGGIYMSGGTLRNSLIARNRCTNAARGGGMGISGASTLVENCTVTGNSTATGLGGGLYQAGGTVRNTIVYGNTMTPSVPASDNVAKTGGIFTYSCATPLISGGSDAGNTDGDPLFRNPAASDFQITGGSAARNAGVFQMWMSGASDLAGNPRIKGSAVDMGAYELQANLGTVILLR